MNAVGMVLLAWSLAADAAAPRIGVLGEAHQGGCLVTEVVPGGAAETAGLQVGDVITAVDGESVADIPGVARVVRKHQVGDTVSIEFLRGENGSPSRRGLDETEGMKFGIPVGWPSSSLGGWKVWTIGQNCQSAPRFEGRADRWSETIGCGTSLTESEMPARPVKASNASIFHAIHDFGTHVRCWASCDPTRIP